MKREIEKRVKNGKKEMNKKTGECERKEAENEKKKLQKKEK